MHTFPTKQPGKPGTYESEGGHMNERERLEAIKRLVGGAQNISATHEIDGGLRLSLKDCGLAQVAAIQELPSVATCSISGGSLRIAFDSQEGMKMTGKYHELAGEILAGVGGKENVVKLAHCITRLRFTLNDEAKADTEGLSANEGVIQVMQAGGQYQVVVGSKVDDLFEELVGSYGLPNAGEVAVEEDDVDAAASADEKPKGVVATLLDVISGCMGPVLMPMAACGMIKGLVAFAASLGLIAPTDGTYQVLYSIADGFFYFLPVLLGYTSSKKFGCNEFTGMLLGCALVYPAMVNLSATSEVMGTLFAGTAFEMNYYSTFFGIPVVMPLSGYTMSVIPIIVSTFFAAKLERVVRKAMPELVRNFATPVIVFAVMVALTYIVIGPIASMLTSLITLIVSTVYAIPVVGGPLVCLLIGGCFSTLVMFGLHWAFMPISINNMASLGYDPLVGSGIGGFVALGQGLAVVLRTKVARTRGIAIPALVSQFCGIGEPMLYGIQIPSKFLWIQNIVFSAIGGLLCGVFGVKQYINGGMGFFSLPSFVNPATNDATGMYIYAAILGVLMVASFIFTMLTYHDDGCYIGAKKADR